MPLSLPTVPMMCKSPGDGDLAVWVCNVDDSQATSLQPAAHRQLPGVAARGRLIPNPPDQPRGVLPRRARANVAGGDSIDTTVRRRRLVWAGSVVRQDAKPLHRRVMFRERERPTSGRGARDGGAQGVRGATDHVRQQ